MHPGLKEIIFNHYDYISIIQVIIHGNPRYKGAYRPVPLLLTNKVDQLAERIDRPRDWILKQALTAWIDQEEERERLTREILADVGAGHVIDHQAAQAWTESLSTNTPLTALR